MIASLALSALLLGAAPGPDPSGLHLVQATEAPPAAASPPAAAPRQRVRRPAPRRAARRAVPNQQTEVIAPVPAPPPAPQAEIAPMPNRDIEAPRGPIQRETTQLRPDLIRPRALPDARNQFDNEYARDRDNLYREPAAGARMNIPFSY